MTIRMLQAWNGYPAGTIVTLVAGEETRLVGLGLATTDLGKAPKAPYAIIVSDVAPNNADGMPDGTVYIQTA